MNEKKEVEVVRVANETRDEKGRAKRHREVWKAASQLLVFGCL